MIKLFTTILMIATISSASTVHYDKKIDNNKDTVKYSGKKVKSTPLSKVNYPNNKLYNLK